MMDFYFACKGNFKLHSQEELVCSGALFAFL